MMKLFRPNCYAVHFIEFYDVFPFANLKAILCTLNFLTWHQGRHIFCNYHLVQDKKHSFTNLICALMAVICYPFLVAMKRFFSFCPFSKYIRI